MKHLTSKIGIFLLMVLVTMSSTSIPSFAAEQQQNQVYDITTTSELETELSNANNEFQYAQVYQQTDPNVISEYLESNLTELNDVIDEIDPFADTQKEFNKIASENEMIDTIVFTSEEDSIKDITRSTIKVTLENGAEVCIECVDEPERNIIFEALAGTIIYKEYGDRRYTANKYFDVCGIKCSALNRIGYNLSKSNKSLTFNYTLIDTLNTGNVWSGYVSTVTCIKSYVNWFGKKRSAANYQYLQSNGVYKYLWETTVPVIGTRLTSSSTEYMNAYVYALSWGATTVKINETFQ